MTHGLVVAATVSPECTRQQMRANRGRRKPTERLWDGLRVRRLHRLVRGSELHPSQLTDELGGI